MLQNNDCIDCPRGTYDNNWKDEAGVEQCVKCEEGFTSEIASDYCIEGIVNTLSALLMLRLSV